MSDLTPLSALVSRFRVTGEPQEGAAPSQSPVSCLRCQDAGYVRVVKKGELLARVVPCPDCSRARALERFARVWPAPPNFARLGTEPLQILDPASAPRLAEALEVVSDFTRTWPGGILVVFDGDHGVAKTHLLSVIYQAAATAGKTAIYRSVPVIERMLTRFKSWEDYASDELTPDQAWEDLLRVDVLLLDEAGRYTRRENGDGWTERSLFTLIDERLTWGRSTVLAGNNLAGVLHSGIKSRALAGDSAWVDLGGIPDARPHFARNVPGWRTRAAL